jgi:ATP-binding cassette subfamily A (ABC1) protein 3
LKCKGRLGKKIKKDDGELDSDVIKEQERIDNTDPQDLAVRAAHLRKIFGFCGKAPNLAVKDVSFGLEFGDCFALLGVNGAGKTSTFKILINDVIPNKGE